MMPAGGAETRAEQLATLSLLAHQQLTAAEIGDLLAEAESAGDALDPWQRGNLREMRRRRSNATAVPGALVEAVSRVSSECETVWRKARPGTILPQSCRHSTRCCACSARLPRLRRKGSGEPI